MKQTTKYRFEYDNGNGNEEFEAEVEIETSYDANWGADADGNRGVPRVEIEEVKVISIFNEYTEKEVLPIPDAMREFVEENAELD